MLCIHHTTLGYPAHQPINKRIRAQGSTRSARKHACGNTTTTVSPQSPVTQVQHNGPVRLSEHIQWNEIVVRSRNIDDVQLTGCVRDEFDSFGGEVLVIRPHLLSESAQGYSLLNLREDEGQEEVLEEKDEKEESDVDEKVKEVRENAQLMQWDGMRRNCKHLEPLCDVQGMSGTTAKHRLDYEDCNTTRMLTCSPSVLSRCTHCWVSCCASC